MPEAKKKKTLTQNYHQKTKDLNHFLKAKQIINSKEKLKTVDPGPKDPDTKFQTQKKQTIQVVLFSIHALISTFTNNLKHFRK